MAEQVVKTAAGKTFSLTKGPDQFQGGAGDDTFVATSNTLSLDDSINGGGGNNTLKLVGGGTFDLSLPETFKNIQVVNAQEASLIGANIIDNNGVLGDFIPSFVGAHNGNLDVVTTFATFDGVMFHIGATVNNIILPGPNALYVFGFDRGVGTARFGAIATGVLFDSVITLTTGAAGIILGGRDLVTNLPIDMSTATVRVSGATFQIDFAASLLPSQGFSPDHFGVNLWPRDPAAPPGNGQISDFAPNNSDFTVSAPTASQVVTLRDDTHLTVNVAPDPSGNPNSGITIIGAHNSDIINLSAGHDTVVLGSARETVNGKGGTNVFQVNAHTIGATINGGGGQSLLLVTNANAEKKDADDHEHDDDDPREGAIVMGANITNVARVLLQDSMNFVANGIAGLQISGSTAGGDVITIGAASQQVVAGGPNETIKASAANAGALVKGLGPNSTLEITSAGTVTLNAATKVDTVKLDDPSVLHLNAIGFIHAIGSKDADTITAGGKDQILTGGKGIDTLVGFSGGSDTFLDTASGLKGDTIQGFIKSDVVDITDLGFAGAKLMVAANGANTDITVTSGSGLITTTFTMTGGFKAADFVLSSDGAAGTLLKHA